MRLRLQRTRDFHKNSSGGRDSSVVSASNVDNPMTQVWDSNATAGNVTMILNGAAYTNTQGDIDCGVIQEQSAPWATFYLPTRDQKTSPGCNSSNPVVDWHIRWYGDYYDVNMGYFVFAETHKDINDNCPGDFGYQEEAEHHTNPV